MYKAHGDIPITPTARLGSSWEGLESGAATRARFTLKEDNFLLLPCINQSHNSEESLMTGSPILQGGT